MATGTVNEVDTVALEKSMDEMVVVATIKETGAMRQQPAAVSLVDKQQLDDQHITSLKGVSALVPNFYMPDYGSRLTSAVYIRGIGSRINTPAVGLYVDNVPYVDKSAFDFNFYDIERLDILRGPQGTLYGRNAMGGIVKVHTKNPFNYQGSDIHLGFASGDLHRNVSLTHYHRVSDKLAFSGGGYYEGGSGFFDNDFTGRKADGLESGGGRLRAIYKANERLTLDASLNYDYTDERAYPYYGEDGSITANHDGRYRRSLLNGGVNVEYKADKWQMNAVTGYQNLRDRMFMDQDFTSSDLYTLEQKQRIHTLNEEVTFKSRTHGLWEWVSGVNLMYQWLNTKAPVTFYGEGLDWLGCVLNHYMPDVNQIPSLSRMGFSDMSVNFRNAPVNLGGEFDTPTLGAALFHQSTFHLTERLSASVGLRVDFERDRLSYHAPSTVDYGFTLENTNNKMMHVDLQDLTSQLLYDGELSHNYLKVLPKFSMKYDLRHGSNLYLSVGKGMRSGGYNVQMFSEILQGALRVDMMDGIKTGVRNYLQKFTAMGMPESVISSVVNTMEQNMPKFELPVVESVTYKPEYSWSYEAGTHLNLAEGRLQADAALFYMHTRDQQIARFTETGMGRMMVNAGKSESYGAELSLRYLPNRHLSLMGNYGYTHAKFTEWSLGAGQEDYSGNYVPFVPQHTANIDAAYTWFTRSRWAKSLTLGANYSGAGCIYWTEANNVRQDFYSLLGARLSLEMPNCSVSLWGKNLTDTRYNTFYFESVGRGFEQHSKPLQVGIDVKISL